MRFSKSSVVAIALAFACSATNFSAVANAQTPNQDFPWRSKSKRKAAVESVKASLATPTRDITTSETIAEMGATPTFDAMPEVIYDEGKKYVRRGDTYFESSDYSAVASPQEKIIPSPGTPVAIPAVKKSSIFQKTKEVTKRLNPFSKSSHRETAYRADDWKVPSFSQSLPLFAKKNNDPITFAAVTPLPAKSSVPTSLNEVPTMMAAKKSYKSPTLQLPPRDSHFRPAPPTETKLTSVFSRGKETASESKFKPANSTAVASSAETRSPSLFSPKSKVRSEVSNKSTEDFSPENAGAAKLTGVARSASLPSSFQTKPRSQADVEDLSKGFTHTQEISTKIEASVETKTASNLPFDSKARSAVGKSVTKIEQKVSQDFSPRTEAKTEIRREVSKVKSKTVKPVRTASHALSADHEFWSPRR